MDTPHTSADAAEAPDQLPHRTDGRDAAAADGRQVAEAEAARRAAARPSRPAIDGEQPDSTAPAP